MITPLSPNSARYIINVGFQFEISYSFQKFNITQQYLTILFEITWYVKFVNTHLICMDDSFADAENNLSASFFAILPD